MHSQAGAPVQSTSREVVGSASASEPALAVGSSRIEPASAPPTERGKLAAHVIIKIGGDVSLS